MLFVAFHMKIIRAKRFW